MVDFINVYALLEETALDTASVAEVVIKYELVARTQYYSEGAD